MFLKQIFLGIVGVSFGMFAAGGVFTVLISVGLIPRFAGKMHVSRKVFLFEEAVVCGTLFGDFFSVFDRYGHIGDLVIKNQVFGKGNTEAVWHVLGLAVLMVFGLFFSIWFPMRATNALMVSVRTAYHLGPPRRALVHRFKTLLYTVLLILTIALTLALMRIRRTVYSSVLKR